MTNDDRWRPAVRSQEFGSAAEIWPALGTTGDERKRYMMRLYMRRSLFVYGNI